MTFLVLAPEHELVPTLATPDQAEAVAAYVEAAKRRSELDRLSEVKKVSGVFTGSYCLHPFSGEPIPIFLADYVLAGYGTGAVMGVPSGDARDWAFATHFALPIVPILDAQQGIEHGADPTKEGRYINSGFIDGLTYAEATPLLISRLEALGAGRGKIQYRLRNGVFSRQRYWGEPVPVYFKNSGPAGKLPYLIAEADLPLELPPVGKYLPTETGEPPLARAEGWKYQGEFDYELSTMPGWAGSSWYWYRYMDPHNAGEFASKEAIDYWRDVDLYIGGSEHATGHLLYSRFWNKFLKDIGRVPEEEFAKKLVNQGMIQGRSNFVYRVNDPAKTTFVSAGLKDQYEVTPLHVDVNLVENDVLDIEAFRSSRSDVPEDAVFLLENGEYRCGWEVEKMSKRWFNVVNPDTLVEKYGADTLRLYEMFLGPLTDSKPWNTNGINGTYNFLRKFWRLFFNETTGQLLVSDEAPNPAERKALHRAIKKVGEDIEALSFNTSVPAFMVLANELSSLNCHKRLILSDFVLILAPFAPHIAEELWAILGHEPGSVSRQAFPVFNPDYLVESSFEYPVQINGKVRATINFALDTPPADIEKAVLSNETVLKWLDGKAPKKVVVVPKRIVNVVV